MEPEGLVERALEKLNKVLDEPLVPKDELVPMMNELAAIVSLLYLTLDTADKEQAKKIKNLIKGLEGLIGTLKYQYKSYIDFRGDDR